MLTELSIRDFAIIDQLELSFQAGLSVFTGATGAGKSILFDALQLALGARADASGIRHQCERAEVVAVFDLSQQSAAQQWLQQQQLECDQQAILRRVIGADGRSRAWINATSVPVQTLKEFGEMLVEVHGQHEHQRLLRGPEALRVIDSYASHAALLATLAKRYGQWQQARDALARLRESESLSPAEIDLLRYQLEELQSVAHWAEQLDALHQEHQRLAHGESLIQACSEAIAKADGNEEANAIRLLSQSRHLLDAGAALDSDLKEAQKLLEESAIQAQEAVALMRRFHDQTELDPERFSEIEKQLGRVHELARKHRVEAAHLPTKLQELEQRLQIAQGAEEHEQQLQAELDNQAQGYEKTARKVSRQRRRAATSLSTRVTELMQQLGMAGGVFEIVVETDQGYRAHGLDRIGLRVSTNPGQPPRPLAKIASGGELSRIALALKVALLDVDNPGSMLFDEVDSGVGGATAQIVGEKLRAVARQRQVFCVTHLPQVAACGDHHYRVEKNPAGARIEQLDESRRSEEIARMLGGTEITDRSTAHAEEMLAMARQS